MSLRVGRVLLLLLIRLEYAPTISVFTVNGCFNRCIYLLYGQELSILVLYLLAGMRHHHFIYSLYHFFTFDWLLNKIPFTGFGENFFSKWFIVMQFV